MLAKTVTGSLPHSPYYLKALCLGIPAYLIGIQLYAWIFLFPALLNGAADFRQLYTAAFMVRGGYAHVLYHYQAQYQLQNELVSRADVALPFIRPAYSALLFTPLSLLPFRAAFGIFLIVNCCCMVLCFRLMQPWMQNLGRIYKWFPAALFAAFLPICIALIQGQDSIILLLLVILALRAVARRQEFIAGCILALGLFKFQIVVPITLVFLLRGRWRFVAGCLVVGLTLLGISIAVTGIPESAVYARSLVGMNVQAITDGDQFRYTPNLAVMPNLHGLLHGVLGAHTSKNWIQVFTLLLSCGLLAWTAWTTRREEGTDLFLVATTLATLVSYYMFVHDLSVLLVPIVMSLDRCIAAEGAGFRKERWIFRVAALAFTAPVLVSWSVNRLFLAAIPILTFLVVQLMYGTTSRMPSIEPAR